MTVEEAERREAGTPAAPAVPEAPAAPVERAAPPRIHRLSPEAVSTIESAFRDAGRKAPPRVSAVGVPPRALLPLINIHGAPGADADVVLICPPEDEAEVVGPNLSALDGACAAVVAAAVPGQTVILTSVSYVGCARELLLVPLEKRGLVPGRDVHVAVCPEPIPDLAPGDRRFVGGATASCAAAATAILEGAVAVTTTLTLEDAEVFSLSSKAPTGLGAAAKRVVDVIGAAFGLVLLAPVMGLVAAAIAADSPGPVLFTQERVGRNGRRFLFRKFRTMTDGAEHRLGEVLHLNGITGPAFQLEQDPRVTRIGRLLRRSSLDELPELWNVLRGEMSLVGPRPAPVFEVAAYKSSHLRRLAMKPGLTGLAQVRQRKYSDFAVKVGLDLQYIDHWSLWLDVRILLETLPAVLRLTGR